MQRAITVGEYEGCTNIVRNSALIEFPSVDGIYNAVIANADYDGMYMILGTNFFENSLIGFCKDDALDAGSDDSGDPLGGVRVENCWIESALHEAMAWSGNNRRTWTVQFRPVEFRHGHRVRLERRDAQPGLLREQPFDDGQFRGRAVR